MNDKLEDKITIGFFIVILILAIILTVRCISVPTKRTYRVYNDRNNYTIVEE